MNVNDFEYGKLPYFLVYIIQPRLRFIKGESLKLTKIWQCIIYIVGNCTNLIIAGMVGKGGVKPPRSILPCCLLLRFCCSLYFIVRVRITFPANAIPNTILTKDVLTISMNVLQLIFLKFIIIIVFIRFNIPTKLKDEPTLTTSIAKSADLVTLTSKFVVTLIF